VSDIAWLWYGRGRRAGQPFCVHKQFDSYAPRVGTPGVARGQEEQPVEGPSLIFLDGVVHLFTLIAL